MKYNVRISTDTQNQLTDQSTWTITMFTTDEEDNLVEQNGPGVNAQAQLNYLNNRAEKADWTNDQIVALSNYLDWIVIQVPSEEYPVPDFYYEGAGAGEIHTDIAAEEPETNSTTPPKPPISIIKKITNLFT